MDSVISSASPTHGSDPSGAIDLSLKIDMLVRTWASSHREPHASEKDEWDPQPGLFALIEDVIASRRGTLLLANDLIYVSGFQRASEALVAARQIQIAVQGFRRRHSTVPVAVSVAIDASQPAAEEGSADRSDGAEPPHELVSLLRISKPAQILLTHDAFQRISGSAGIPLKPFPGRFGVHEYLWIGEDQLEILRSEPQLTLAVVTRETPAPGSLPVLPAEPAASQATLRTPQPATHLGRSTPLSELALSPRGANLLRSPRLWVMAAVPLLVVALIVGIVVSRSPSHPAGSSPGSSQKSAAAPGIPSSPSTSVPAASTASARPAPAPGKSVSGPPRTQTAAVKSLPPAKAKKQPRPAEAAPAAVPVPPPPAPSAPCVQRADMTKLYSLAEQYRQQGHFQDAERLFRDVLNCDPNNADAKNGLERTLEAERIHPQ